jgi:tripartite-type tricarboxylate transporter receptor subunit TctC
MKAKLNLGIFILCGAVSFGTAMSASAQSYPEKPIKIIVPNAGAPYWTKTERKLGTTSDC